MCYFEWIDHLYDVIGYDSREKSAVSHSITWRHPISARRVDIEGATAFAVSGLFLFIYASSKLILV